MKIFCEAMKLKLRLNFKGRLQTLRKSIAEEYVKRHPKADLDEILIAMKKQN